MLGVVSEKHSNHSAVQCSAVQSSAEQCRAAQSSAEQSSACEAVNDSNAEHEN